MPLSQSTWSSILLLLSLGCSSLPFFGGPVERNERACDRGDARACGRLGYFYSEGKHVEPDSARALSLLDRACDGGDASGCFNLAIELVNGPEATRDAPRARSVLEAPCAKQHAGSCGLLGILRRDGLGGPTDLPNAIPNFESACSGGNSGACNNLAVVYWKGEGVEEDKGRAAELFRRACAEGLSISCEGLERLESGELAPSDRNFSARTTIETTTINDLVFEGVASSCGMPQTILILSIVREAAAECAEPELSPRMFLSVAGGTASAAPGTHSAVGTCVVRAVTRAQFGDTVCSLVFALRQP